MIEGAVATAAYLALVLARTWTTYTKGGVRVIGGAISDDQVGTQWAWWWTAFAVRNGEPLLDAGWTFYPWGIYPLGQFNLVDAFIALPFELALGPYWGFDAAVVFMLVSTALAVHGVARWEGARPLAAATAGTLVLCSQFITLEITTGRIGQAFLALLVLCLGLWRQVARRGGLGWGAAAGVASALCFLEYWYYGMFLGFAAAALLCSRPAPGHAWRDRLAPAALGLGLTLAGTLPFVALLLGEGATLPGMETATATTDHGVAAQGRASLSWAMDFSHTARWPLWPRQAGIHSGMLTSGLPGSWLAMALLPLAVFRRDRGAWLAVAGVGVVLAMGPFLRLDDATWLTDISLPFLWLADHLPFFDRLWWPYRAAPLALAALAVLAARNATDVADELPARWRRPALGGAALIVLLELLHTGRLDPLGSSSIAPPPPAYAHLDGPTVTLPITAAQGAPALALSMQIAHEQPILYGLGGHLDGHRPAAVQALLDQNLLLRALMADGDPEPLDPRLLPEHLGQLADLGYRWLLLDRRGFGADAARRARAEALLSAALGPPLEDDGDAMVWPLPGAAAR